jgi:ribosomal RNA assembly protein
MIEFVLIPDERLKIFRDRRLLYTRKLRDLLDVKLWVADSGVEIEGNDPIVVMRSKEIVRAFGRGFSWEDALNLADEDYMLEVINTTDFTGKSRNRQIVLKGRVIGSEGRSKDIIEKYSGAKIAVYGKTISIIGKWDSVKLAREAVRALLSGAKHTGVFKMLEEQKIV